MNNRRCPMCDTLVKEDEICKCLENKVREKRNNMKNKGVDISVLIVNKEDTLVFHIPESEMIEFGTEDSIRGLQTMFPGINIAIVGKGVDIEVVKKGE